MFGAVVGEVAGVVVGEVFGVEEESFGLDLEVVVGLVFGLAFG